MRDLPGSGDHDPLDYRPCAYHQGNGQRVERPTRTAKVGWDPDRPYPRAGALRLGIGPSALRHPITVLNRVRPRPSLSSTKARTSGYGTTGCAPYFCRAGSGVSESLPIFEQVIAECMVDASLAAMTPNRPGTARTQHLINLGFLVSCIPYQESGRQTDFDLSRTKTLGLGGSGSRYCANSGVWKSF